MNQTRLISCCEQLRKALAIGKTGATLTGRIGGILVLLLLCGNAFAGLGDVDDGWRRTKDGWEHISQWQLTSSQMELLANTPSAPAVLSPTAEQLMSAAHPVLFAIGIAILGGVALYSPRFHKTNGL